MQHFKMIQRHFRAAGNITGFISIASVLCFINLSLHKSNSQIFDKSDVREKMLQISTTVKMTATKKGNYFIIPSTVPQFI